MYCLRSPIGWYLPTVMALEVTLVVILLRIHRICLRLCFAFASTPFPPGRQNTCTCGRYLAGKSPLHLQGGKNPETYQAGFP